MSENLKTVQLSEDSQARDLAIQRQLAKELRRLRESERGRAVLKALEIFLQSGGAGLDEGNKAAVDFIIQIAFGCPWNLPGGFKLLLWETSEKLKFKYNGQQARCTLGDWELHCGDCFKLTVDGKTVDTRLESSDDWWLVGLGNASLYDGFEGSKYQ